MNFAENKKYAERIEMVLQYLKEAGPEIQQYLDKTVFTSEMITPNRLEDLGRI